MPDILIENITRIYPSAQHAENITLEPDADGLDMLRILYCDGDRTYADFNLTTEVARVLFTEGLKLLDAGPLERRVKVQP